jgi:signal transduction histidine kinase
MVHRTDLLEDVLRISSSIVSERDLKKLSSMILTSVSTLFGFERVTLVVYDEALGAFRWVALYGYPDEAVRESRVRSVPMDVILEDLRESRRIGRTVYYTPVEEVSPRQLSHFVMPERALAAKASGERSPGEFREGDSLAFSLHDSNGRIVGVIYPSMPRESRIPDADTIETIEIFTSLAEVAIENAHLSSEKEVALRVSGQRAEQMSRIFDLITDVLYVRDLDQLLADVLKILSQLLGVRRMLISVLDKEAGVFRARAVHGYPEDTAEVIKRIEYPVGRINFLLDPKGKPLSDTPVKWRKKVGRMTYYVPAEGYAVQPEDMVYYPEPELIRLPRKGEGYWHELDYMDTFMFDREGEVVAYIEFNKPRDDRIPDSDTIEVVEIFASLAGVAIENATMFEAQVESRKSAEFYTDLLSHDIKNFNQAILGYLDMLKSTLVRPEQVTMTGKLSQQVLNIGRLASNVRTMSRLTWGSSKLVRTDLDAVLLDCMASVPQYYMSRKMVFKHELSAGNHHVMADGLMKELFVNLMTNAVKYDPHEPVDIELRIERVQHDGHASWLVSVADRGRGVPDDLKDKIFGRFIQGYSKKGSGLGLHIVSMLTKNYHGRAWVEDRVTGDHKQGAVFKVELPLVE